MIKNNYKLEKENNIYFIACLSVCPSVSLYVSPVCLSDSLSVNP